MSTPEQPATPPLTRRQLREIRNTGANPVIPPADAEPADAPPEQQDLAAPADADSPGGAATTPVSNGDGSKKASGAASPKNAPKSSSNGKSAPAAPLPRAAEPVVVPPPPIADGAVDLGVSPLTRRQARQQERIRTASVPVITPEVVAAHAAGPVTASFAAPPAFSADLDAWAPPRTEAAAPAVADAPSLTKAPDRDGEVSTDSGVHELFGITREPEAAAAPSPWAEPAEVPVDAAPADEATLEADAADEAETDHDDGAKAVVSPLLGAGLLGGGGRTVEPVVAELPPSFDQLLSRSSGSSSAPNALIVSQSPEVSPLVGPVTATGEVLITGTFNLPEGLGSTGHAKGTADGKEIDATLVDGELPSHSSPTPIAASAAVSTVKMPGEVIRPPAPEKGSRLMMSLAITAGVLALALVGVLILAFVTGVF